MPSVSYRYISQILVSSNRTDGLLPTGVFSGITKFLVKMSRVEVYLPSSTHTRMRDNGKTCPRVRLPSVLPNQPTRVARAVVPLQPCAPPPGPPQRRRQQRVRRLHPARAGPRPPRAARAGAVMIGRPHIRREVRIRRPHPATRAAAWAAPAPPPGARPPHPPPASCPSWPASAPRGPGAGGLGGCCNDRPARIRPARAASASRLHPPRLAPRAQAPLVHGGTGKLGADADPRGPDAGVRRTCGGHDKVGTSADTVERQSRRTRARAGLMRTSGNRGERWRARASCGQVRGLCGSSGR